MRWMTWAAVLLTAVLLPRSAAAQAATGRVGGEVHDTTGAVVAHGTAQLRELDTNLDWTQHVDGAGRFVFLTLPVGRYELTVSCDRFRTVRSQFALSVGQRVDLPITVEISGIEERVDVATAGALETTRTHSGTTVTAREIESLAAQRPQLPRPGAARAERLAHQHAAATNASPRPRRCPARASRFRPAQPGQHLHRRRPFRQRRCGRTWPARSTRGSRSASSRS